MWKESAADSPRPYPLSSERSGCLLFVGRIVSPIDVRLYRREVVQTLHLLLYGWVTGKSHGYKHGYRCPLQTAAAVWWSSALTYCGALLVQAAPSALSPRTRLPCTTIRPLQLGGGGAPLPFLPSLLDSHMIHTYAHIFPPAFFCVCVLCADDARLPRLLAGRGTMPSPRKISTRRSASTPRWV